MKRRDMLKGLTGLPVFGIFIYELLKKRRSDQSEKKAILSELGLDGQGPAVVPETTMKKSGELIRLGIIGLGIRGEQHLRAAGFAHPDWIEEESEHTKEGLENNIRSFMEQEDLNVAIMGICDVFDLHAERGMEIVKNGIRPHESQGNSGEVKRYRCY